MYLKVQKRQLLYYLLLYFHPWKRCFFSSIFSPKNRKFSGAQTPSCLVFLLCKKPMCPYFSCIIPWPSKNSAVEWRSRRSLDNESSYVPRRGNQTFGSQRSSIEVSDVLFQLLKQQSALDVGCGYRCFWWQSTKLQVLHDLVQGRSGGK